MKFPVSLSGLVLVAALLGSLISPTARAEVTLLNVSYDPTREFYDAYNQEFAQYWKKQTGEEVAIRQSHGGWNAAIAKRFATGAAFDLIYGRK